MQLTHAHTPPPPRCSPHIYKKIKMNRYKYVAGIRPTGMGGAGELASSTLWDSVEIAPALGLEGLPWLNCSFLSPNGLVSLSYTTDDRGKVSLEALVPPGVKGVLTLPGKGGVQTRMPLKGGVALRAEVNIRT